MGRDLPGAAKALWLSLRAVTRDEQRSEQGRARRFRAASREDWATVSELRREVPAAYLLADASRMERMHALGVYLKSGDPSEAAKLSKVPLRTLQRWLHEGPSSLFVFGAVYLSARVKLARAALVRDRAEFEARLAVAQQECQEICNREGRLGCRYESDGGGCEACPLHLVG